LITVYSIDVIYLDYRKAFDIIWHSGLYTKLVGYGIGGSVNMPKVCKVGR